ncbi:MAG: hypothetical protein K8R75_02740, partial [Deltaproteobacteria bacterium]|nr:hypothetical protein [Deltaproteobacteria bacterium]
TYAQQSGPEFHPGKHSQNLLFPVCGLQIVFAVRRILFLVSAGIPHFGRVRFRNVVIVTLGLKPIMRYRPY